MWREDVPTILRHAGPRFVIYLEDHPPPHVHVKGRGHNAEIEFDGPTVIWNRGFARNELKRALDAIDSRLDELTQAWIAIHG